MSSPEERALDELAAGELDDVDGRILARTAFMYTRLDPPPAGLTERINFAITLDALHAEVAELQRSGDLVGVRSDGATETETITFTAANLTTMVTISAGTADTVRIDGWVDPGGGVTVELRTEDQTLSTQADEDGRFVFDEVAHGLIQFIIRPGEGRQPVITPSIEL